MHDDRKTLAELVEEQSEKKFVSIPTASKISGYTTEYLERLCRGYRMEYRLRPDGAYAIELSTLLKETRTILVSFDGVEFIERQTLTDPHLTVLPADGARAVSIDDPPPHGHSGHSGGVAALSFFGRSVVSGAREDEPEDESHLMHRVHVPIVDVSEHDGSASRGDEGHMSASGPVREPTPLAPSPYRPIATSVDTEKHHDIAPLFPPLRNTEERAMGGESPGVARPTPSVAWGSFAATSELARHASELAGVVGREVATRPGRPVLLSPRIVSSVRVSGKDTLGVFPMSALHEVPELPAPNRTHALLAEHTETHPLLSHLAFNAVFASVFAGAIAALLSASMWKDDTPTVFERPEENVAAITTAALSKKDRTATPVYPPRLFGGRFSDDVITDAAQDGSVMVRPVFRDHVGTGTTFQSGDEQ